MRLTWAQPLHVQSFTLTDTKPYYVRHGGSVSRCAHMRHSTVVPTSFSPYPASLARVDDSVPLPCALAHDFRAWLLVLDLHVARELACVVA